MLTRDKNDKKTIRKVNEICAKYHRYFVKLRCAARRKTWWYLAQMPFTFLLFLSFLSRVSILLLTSDIDIVMRLCLYVCLFVGLSLCLFVS